MVALEIGCNIHDRKYKTPVGKKNIQLTLGEAGSNLPHAGGIRLPL